VGSTPEQMLPEVGVVISYQLQGRLRTYEELLF
jgi:hypothetical protein